MSVVTRIYKAPDSVQRELFHADHPRGKPVHGDGSKPPGSHTTQSADGAIVLKAKVLVVDDETSVCSLLRSFLEGNGFQVAVAESSRDAREVAVAFQPDVALVDYALPDATALDLLRQFKELQPGLPVVILTGHASIELAVAAIKQGAQNFIAKPMNLRSLAVTLQQAVAEKRANRPSSGSNGTGFLEIPDPFVGSSRLIRELAEQAHKVAGCHSPVLILGATGTGKGVLARWLHAHSARAHEPFVDLNCAGLSRELLETELFGHQEGAFTGAIAAKSGLFEIADGGTIFLDDVGDMDPKVQPRLLKVLEERRFRRLGDLRDREVDVRLIAATYEDLNQLVQEKRFRSDLYFRINTLRLRLPPLSSRTEDIAPLCECILAMMAQKTGFPRPSLAPAALKLLQEYSWPGNVRELRNVLERALVLGCGPILRPEHLSFEQGVRFSSNDPGSLTLTDLEKLHIFRVLQEEHGRVPVAAKRLGIGRSSLYKKIKDYGIAPGT